MGTISPGPRIQSTHSITAAPIPRYKPFGPSFFKMTLTPWKTPLYSRGASCLACNSPWSCRLVSLGSVLPSLFDCWRQLPDLDGLEGMSRCDSTTSCYPACDEGSDFRDTNQLLLHDLGFGGSPYGGRHCTRRGLERNSWRETVSDAFGHSVAAQVRDYLKSESS